MFVLEENEPKLEKITNTESNYSEKKYSKSIKNNFDSKCETKIELKPQEELIIKLPIAQINMEANIKKLNKLKKNQKKPKKNKINISNSYILNFNNNLQFNTNQNQNTQNKLNINVPAFIPKSQNSNDRVNNQQKFNFVGQPPLPPYAGGRQFQNSQNFGNNMNKNMNNNNGFNNFNNNSPNNMFNNLNNLNPMLIQQLLNLSLNGNNGMNNSNRNQYNNNMMNNNINGYILNLLNNMNNNGNNMQNSYNGMNFNLLPFLGNNLKNNQEEISIIRTIKENTEKGQKIYKLKYSTSLVKNNKNRKYQK